MKLRRHFEFMTLDKKTIKHNLVLYYKTLIGAIEEKDNLKEQINQINPQLI